MDVEMYVQKYFDYNHLQDVGNAHHHLKFFA